MAKGDCGLPANSKTAPRLISREEEKLRWNYATQPMTFQEYERRLKLLKKKGLA